MYFATYKKFGTYFFRFGNISQIFTFNMVKNEKAQSVKIDLNKKLDPKQKAIQAFNIDIHRSRKTKMKILPCGK